MTALDDLLDDLLKKLEPKTDKELEKNRAFLYKIVKEVITKCGFPTEIDLVFKKYDTLNKAHEEIWKMPKDKIEKVLSTLRELLTENK